MPGINLLNFTEEKDVVAKLKEMTTYGPDVGIEAVGCHYNKSLLHTVETTLGLETDTGDLMNEIIKAVRKVFQQTSDQVQDLTADSLQRLSSAWPQRCTTANF